MINRNKIVPSGDATCGHFVSSQSLLYRRQLSLTSKQEHFEYLRVANKWRADSHCPNHHDSVDLNLLTHQRSRLPYTIPPLLCLSLLRGSSAFSALLTRRYNRPVRSVLQVSGRGRIGWGLRELERTIELVNRWSSFSSFGMIAA